MGSGSRRLDHLAGKKSSFGAYVQKPQPLVMKDGKVERIATPAQHPSHQGTFPFAGVDDHYFVAMLSSPGSRACSTRRPCSSRCPGSPNSSAS